MNRKRNYRRRRSDSDNEDEIAAVSDVLEERKEMQKFRQKSKGLSASALAFGLKVEPEVEIINDPFKLKTGGLIEMDAIKDRDRDRTGEEGDIDVTNLGSNFSLETNRRDEDVEMLKYIEEEMSKRKGKQTVDDNRPSTSSKSTKEDLLFAVPESIDVKSSAMKSEEMLSNQMLSGIPEVNLGIQAKIKNIEQTEEAKVKILAESRKKKQIASDFVPTNMASNFVHHDRFYDEKKAIDKERLKARKDQINQGAVKPKGPVVGSDLVDDTTSTVYARQLMGHEKGKKRDSNSDKASDDFLYERFRKKARDSWRYQ